MMMKDKHGDDKEEVITFSRRAARYLSQFPWYYTRRGAGDGPSLDDAWHHYEHVTLARCYKYDDDQQLNINLVRASASERDRPTRLYPVVATPLQDLTHFGVSTRMYFSTVLVLSGTMALAGLLNIPLMIYFWNYATGNKAGVSYMGLTTIRSSALCDATEWVYCDTCNDAAHQHHYPEYRLDGTRARRNVCNFEDWLTVGILSYAATLVVLVLVGVAFWKQRKAEIVFDEAIQTASDYSIKVSNPPPDALDPEEWRLFFLPYAAADRGVVMVTIAIDNAQLIKALVSRRQKLQQLAYILPPGTDMTDYSQVWNLILTTTRKPWLSYLYLATDATKLWHDIQQLEEEIRGLVQQKYKAVAVFVTFETERSQRDALHALSMGKLHIWYNSLDRSRFGRGGVLQVRESIRSSSLWDCLENDREFQERTIHLATSSTNSNDSHFKALLLRGYHVLSVKEAVEPSDVRWIDLQVSNRHRLELYIASTVGMIVFVMWSGYFIYTLVKQYPGYYATIFITMTNVIVPIVCELIGEFESHPTEHGKQISLYVKITIFRCFNSAIVLSVISSFIEYISVENNNEDMQQSLIYKVYPVIVAELFCTPIVELMDPEGNFRKHILAPRARDQEEMNACFRGGRFWLAERYTNANKVLFVSLYFSAILPEAFFLGALALLAQYYVGKFALLRLCGPCPDIGFHLSRLSRNYFFPFLFTSHVVMSAYWWSGYPYDNVCRVNNAGNVNNGDDDNGGGYTYTFCNQNFYSEGVFPPLPRFQTMMGARWMSASQEVLTGLYGWTSVWVLLVGFVFFLGNSVIPRIRSIYESTYEPDGMDQGINFSTAKHREELNGYIPQVRVPGFVFPLLACDISSNGIDENLIGWKDKDHGYAPHSLVEDVERITKSQVLHDIFSIVQQWTSPIPTMGSNNNHTGIHGGLPAPIAYHTH